MIQPLPIKENDRAEDVLVEATLTEYKQGIAFFSAYLVELNVNLFFAERIIRFPRELFFGAGPDNAIFFHQTVRNAIQMSVLCITKLVIDQGSDAYTLRMFKNRVVKMMKPKYLQAFRERLKVEWDASAVQHLLDRAKILRNTRIAHFDPSLVQDSVNSTMKQEDLLLSEIKNLRDKLNTMFQALAFGIRYGMLPLSYEEGHADIDDMLTRLAQTSDWVTRVKQDPALWQQTQQFLTKEQSEEMSWYRRRLGLKMPDLDASS